MPLVDLPLELLHSYAGRNPRPADFDEFWSRGLDEVSRLSAASELVDVEFPQVAQHVYFEGVGGARIHARRLRPAGPGPFPTVFYFHGYTMRAPDWWGLLAWAAAGFQVVAMDCRGQGGESQDPGGVTGNTHRGHIVRGLADTPEKLYYRQVFLDTAQLVRIALEWDETDSGLLVSTGASQGGGLALACAALEPRIKKCASIFPFLSDYQRVWEMDLAKSAYQELRDFFRLYDPLHSQEQEWFRRLGYIDVQHLAPRIQGDVLLVVSLMDTICPPSTQFAAYNKISSPKQLLVYPDFEHEGLPDSSDHILKFLLK